MNKLDRKRQVRVVAALVEGNSIRATVRMTGVAKGTVLKLLVDLGDACERYQDAALRNLKSKRIQCDEIWSFCYAKAKNVPERLRGAAGVGDAFTGHAFMLDLASRLANKVQLTTDGHKVYLEAVEGAFGNDIDYAMLVKMYEGDSGKNIPSEARYSPAKCTGARTQKITGDPDPAHVSTSFAERQNLTMRMGMRRFTRLTNAFSKKVDNLKAAVALHFMYYNFVRIHQTLRTTPAMAAGVADKLCDIADMVALLK